MITHILYKDQVRHLCSKGLWALHAPDFSPAAAANAADIIIVHDPNNDKHDSNDDDGTTVNDDDGIVYNDDNHQERNDDDEDDPLLFVNTNRIGHMAIQDSDDSSEEDQRHTHVQDLDHSLLGTM
jgi:hypothetical protein